MTIDLRVTRTRSGRPSSVTLFADDTTARDAVMALARLIGPLAWGELVGHVNAFDDANTPAEQDQALTRVDDVLDEVRAEHGDDAITSLWCLTVPEHEADAFTNRVRAALTPPVVVHPSQRRLHAVPNPGGAA